MKETCIRSKASFLHTNKGLFIPDYYTDQAEASCEEKLSWLTTEQFETSNFLLNRHKYGGKLSLEIFQAVSLS